MMGTANMDDAMQKLRVWLRREGVPQVDECETDADVVLLAVRVMDAMTRAYKTVTDMLEATVGVRDEVEKRTAADKRVNEQAARNAMRGGNRGKRKR